MTVSADSTAGYTVVSARALRRLVVHLAADVTGVPPRLVTAALSDGDASLRVSLTMPACLQRHGTVLDQSDTVRTQVITGMERLGQRVVSSVDIRFTGAVKGRWPG